MRGFFGKIGNSFRRLMYGRNGVDKLCYVALFGYLGLWVVSFVTAGLDLTVATYIIWGVQIAVLVYVEFRIFSKNIAKRRRENERFFGFFRNKRNRFKDRKTHIYKKCPHCRAMLRLPKKKGKHTVCCPACRERFSVKIRRNGRSVSRMGEK